LLLGYIEYFGVQRVVICLSDNYGDGAINRTHAIDPVTGCELKMAVELPFSTADVEVIYDYKLIPEGAFQKAFSVVLPGAVKKQYEAEKDRVIEEAVGYAFANCGAKRGRSPDIRAGQETIAACS
jgi:hypothetical protein